MTIALLLASLAIGSCADLPFEDVRTYLAGECDGLPVTQEGACDRAQLDDHDPDWRNKGNADIFQALLTAFDRVGAEVTSGALSEQEGEARMAKVKAALAQAAHTHVGRQQAIARALTSNGIAQ
jgi:hypothetical protein